MSTFVANYPVEHQRACQIYSDSEQHGNAYHYPDADQTDHRSCQESQPSARKQHRHHDPRDNHGHETFTRQSRLQRRQLHLILHKAENFPQ